MYEATTGQWNKIISQFGNTDTAYLEHHFNRFKNTFNLFSQSWNKERGNRVLDIGAHWLHQSLFYSLNGFQVTACDFPATLQQDSVIKLAQNQNISLLPYTDLESPSVFNNIKDDAFDIILFTEIIEHITFNPIDFWKEIYRVLAPNGRIIITTPNYYSWHSRCWSFKRFINGYGGGLTTDSILGMHTYSHHWKEFSLKELSYYFFQMSKDFRIQRREYINDFYPSPEKKMLNALISTLPFLSNDLYLEIDLDKKEEGILIEPAW